MAGMPPGGPAGGDPMQAELMRMYEETAGAPQGQPGPMPPPGMGAPSAGMPAPGGGGLAMGPPGADPEVEQFISANPEMVRQIVREHLDLMGAPPAGMGGPPGMPMGPPGGGGAPPGMPGMMG